MPIIKTPIIQGLKEEFNQYCPEIIVNNLPMIDGLLLSHKKILWGLYKNKVYHNKPYIKSLKAIGYITNFYTFGDAPLYSTMTNMTNNAMSLPLLEGKGSWGNKFKIDGVPAHQRYTECKLAEYGEYMLKGIEKNAVPMKPNYDNTEIEPIISPSIAPNIFLNVSQSISISESSKIPSFNCNETCDSLIHYLKTNDFNKAKEILKCPDFETAKGKIIYDKKDFEKIYQTGRGSFSLVGRGTFDSKKNIFSVYEIPYETTIEAIDNKIIELYEQGKFKEITDTRVANGKEGIRLDIYLKKNTNIQQFEQKLRKYTPYESKFSCNFTILDLDGKTPKLMSLQDIYNTWIQHRINCIKNETMFDINKNKEDLNKLYGLKTINEDLDKAIQIIRSSKTEKIAIEKLIGHFKLNEKQAEYIATIRLVNINQEWIERKIANIQELENKNVELMDYYNSEKDIKETIVTQLEEVKKKYGKPRATEIIYPEEVQDITTEDLIEDNTVTLVLTEQGYIKKNLVYSESQKLKEGDEVKQIFQSTNKTDLLLFSNQGRVFIRKTYELKDCKPSERGEFIPALLGEYLQEDEKIIYIATTKDDYKGKVITVFENGNIGCTDLKKYKCKQNRQVPMDAYNTESPLLDIKVVTDDVNIFMLSNDGKALIVNTKESKIRPTKSRDTKGVVGIRLKGDNKVIGCIIDCHEDNFTIHTEKGKEIDYMLDDIATNTEKSWKEHLKGKRGNGGNFIYNTRQKKDKIIGMVIKK